jgi:Spy/CpxP family protein refolding chaperone
MFGIFVGAGLVILGTAAVLHHHCHAGRSVMLACALRRLKATDEQKQRLTALFDDTRAKLSSVRQHASTLHGELADVVAAPTVDGQRLEALEARLFEVMSEGSQALRDAVSRIHETLEPRQRKQLADWLRRAGHHHYCRAAACHY